jgi:hypothetical protein
MGFIDGSSGFQLRRLDPLAHMPKYLSYKNGVPLSHFLTRDSRTLVVVEDMLSAIRVADLGWHVYVLCGTHADHMRLAEYLNKHDISKVSVWLDNDNPHVRQAARKIADFVQLLGVTETVLITREVDPKRHTDTELRHLLGNSI